MAEPPFNELQRMIGLLEKRAYATYKCRLQAHLRLTRQNHAWNASLIAFSTSTTIASVGILVSRDMYGHGGDTLMVALAILSLVASLVVSSVNFGTRSKAMEASYKRMQQIAIAAEFLGTCVGPDLSSQYADLQRDYASTVDASENHTDADYRRVLAYAPGGSSRVPFRDRMPTLLPAATLVIPVVLLVPFVIWFVR